MRRRALMQAPTARRLPAPVRTPPPFESPERRPAPGFATPQAILWLQSTVGNKVVTRELQGITSHPAAAAGQRTAQIQRVIGRVDEKRSAKKRTAEEIIKTREVDRMIEYLVATHQQPVVDVNEAGTISITPGDHWFAGHGSGLTIGDLSTDKLYKKLSFAALPKGEKATIHLISCNLGKITESDYMAKELRRLIQRDEANEGKTVVVEGAPSFIIHTPALRASFASKDASKAITVAHKQLEEHEEIADRKYGDMLLAGALAHIDQANTKLPRKKKLLAELKAKTSRKDVQSKLDVLVEEDKQYRQGLAEIMVDMFKGDAGEFLRSFDVLAKLIDNENGKTTLADLHKKVLVGLEDESNKIWAEFEQALAPLAKLASPETLTAVDPERAVIKEGLKQKDQVAVSKFGWIQYSTKGKFKAEKKE